METQCLVQDGKESRAECARWEGRHVPAYIDNKVQYAGLFFFFNMFCSQRKHSQRSRVFMQFHTTQQIPTGTEYP